VTAVYKNNADKFCPLTVSVVQYRNGTVTER